MTIGYITLGALDVEGELPFYDSVLGAVDYARTALEDGSAFYGKAGAADIGICKPFDGQPARGGNGIMIAFKTDTQDQVKTAYDAALAHGGSDEGPPGFRPPAATSGFYGAYFRDAAGNKYCVYVNL